MKWISVNDRLPKAMQHIDLWTAPERWPQRIADCFMDKNGVFCKAMQDSSWEVIKNVTHWMPLPEPPKK